MNCAEVREIEVGSRCATHLWVTESVMKALTQYVDGPFAMNVQRMCENGFAIYERGNWPKVKYEWDGVYRIGIKQKLCRLIGVYEDGTSKGHFICPDCLEKGGQNLNASDRQRIDGAASTKKNK